MIVLWIKEDDQSISCMYLFIQFSQYINSVEEISKYANVL